MANVGTVVGYTVMGQEIRLNTPDHDLPPNHPLANDEEYVKTGEESGGVSGNDAKPSTS
jgi:hypothetical protein